MDPAQSVASHSERTGNYLASRIDPGAVARRAPPQASRYSVASSRASVSPRSRQRDKWPALCAVRLLVRWRVLGRRRDRAHCAPRTRLRDIDVRLIQAPITALKLRHYRSIQIEPLPADGWCLSFEGVNPRLGGSARSPLPTNDVAVDQATENDRYEPRERAAGCGRSQVKGSERNAEERQQRTPDQPDDQPSRDKRADGNPDAAKRVDHHDLSPLVCVPSGILCGVARLGPVPIGPSTRANRAVRRSPHMSKCDRP